MKTLQINSNTYHIDNFETTTKNIKHLASTHNLEIISFKKYGSSVLIKTADETLFKVIKIVKDLEKILTNSRRTNNPLKNSPYTSEIIAELLKRLKVKKEEYSNMQTTLMKDFQTKIAEDIELYTAIRNYLDNPPKPENSPEIPPEVPPENQ